MTTILFETSDLQRQSGQEVSFEDATDDVKNRWTVEEWIFAVALLIIRDLALRTRDGTEQVQSWAIVAQIRGNRRRGLKWDTWREQWESWIEGDGTDYREVVFYGEFFPNY